MTPPRPRPKPGSGGDGLGGDEYRGVAGRAGVVTSAGRRVASIAPRGRHAATEGPKASANEVRLAGSGRQRTDYFS